jgi:DNA uptake protein ComE-like DNA-binding protein
VFTKQQRSGIFVLLLVIVALQCVYFFADFTTDELNKNEQQQIIVFQNEIDSLALVKKSVKYKVYPYNPNFITDYKGYVLGMSVEEIDRLHSFRKLDKYVNSAKEFQVITQVSDSLLKIMSPKFKFPDWVTKKNAANKYSSSYQKDLNKAEAKDIHRATDLEYKIAYRIVNFRKKLRGFLTFEQLKDVYGLSEDDIKKVTDKFVLETIPNIKKININLASASELADLVYINEYIAANIVDERVLREGYEELDELKYVAHFPIEKLERIKLYLTINETQK